MRFDNAQFEKNIKQSMDSLDQLDRSIDNLEGSDGLSALSRTVGSVGNGFSTMGVVAFTAIQRITNSVINLGLQLTSKLLAPLNQMKSGGWARAMNIEQAKFQFEGLGMDVEQAMDDAMYAVNETAYSLDAAAMAATQLAASGVKAGDQMKQALRGISGVAAQTNSSYEQIANTFTRVAGNGRLMGDDLRSLSSSGMNAAATLGKYFHKSEADIRQMVSKGKISFDMFSEAMFNTFGEHAVKANETYTGSLANLNAALSKIGADFQQHKIQNSIRIFNSLRKAVNLLRIELSPLAEVYGKVYEAFTRKLSDTIDYFAPDVAKAFGYALEGVLNVLNNLVTVARIAIYTFKDIFPEALSFRISDIAKRFKEFTETLSINEEKMTKIALILRGFWSALKIVSDVIAQIIKGLIPAASTCDSLFDILLNGLAIVGALITKFQKWLEETQAVYYVVAGLRLAIMIVIGAIGALIVKLVELFNKLRQNEQVIKVFNAIKTGIATAVHYIGVAFKYAIEAVKSFVLTMKDLGNAASKVSNEGGISKFSAWLKVLGDNLKNITKEVTPAKVGLVILIGFFSVLAVMLVSAARKMSKGLTEISGTFKFFKDFLKNIAEQRKLSEAEKKFKKFIEVAALLVIFVHELRKLSEADMGNIIAASAGVIAAIVAFGIVVKRISDMPQIEVDKKVKSVLMPLVYAIVAIGWALQAAAKRNWVSLIPAASGLALAIAALALIINQINDLMIRYIDWKKVASISALMTGLASVISAIGFAMRIASKHNWIQITAAAGGLVLALTAIAGAMILLSKLGVYENASLKGSGALLLTALSLIPIAVAMRTASKYDWKSIGAAAIGMSVAIVAVGGILTLLTHVTKDASKAFASAGALLMTSLALIPVAVALNTLSSYDWDTMWQKLILMTGTITVMGGALAALGALATMSNGLGALGILAAGAAYIMFGSALMMAGEGVEKFTNALIKMSTSVDFEKVAKGVLLLQNASWKLATAIFFMGPVLSASLLVASIAIDKFADGLIKLTNVDVSKVVKNFSDFIDSLAGHEATFESISGYMVILSAGLSALVYPLKQLGTPAIAFGTAFLLASVGMLAFAGAMRLLAPALEQFQTLQWTVIAEGIALFANSLYSLVKPGLLISAFADNLLKAAIAIAAFLVEAVVFNFIDLTAIAGGILILAKGFQQLAAHTFRLLTAAVYIGALSASILVLNTVMKAANVVLPQATAALVQCCKVIGQAGKYAATGFITGLASGIASAGKTAILLGKATVSSLCKYLVISSPSQLMQKIGEFTGSGFILGLAENMGEAEKAGTGYGQAVISSLEGMAGQFFSAGAAGGSQVAAGFGSTLSAGLNYMLGRLRTAGNKTNMSERGYTSSGYVSETSIFDNLIGNAKGLISDLNPLESVIEDITKSTGEMADGFDTAGGAMDGAGGKAKSTKDAIKELRDTIEGQINLFEEFNKETDLTADKLIENMKSQISGAAEWTSWMSQLGGKGVSAGLIEKLAKMGQQSGYKYAKAFMDMSAEQIAQANVFFASSLTIPDNSVFAIQHSYQEAGEWAAYGFANGITPDAAKDNVTLLGLRTLEQLKTVLDEHSPSKETEKLGRFYTLGLAIGMIAASAMQVINYNISKLATTIETKLRTELKVDKFKSIGEQVVNGIKKGIDDAKTQSSLFSSVINLCNKVKEAATSKKGFWEQSPSKVFEQIGEYVSLGLAKGISETSNAPVSAISDVTDDVKSGMQTAVDRIRAAFDSDMNITPTIRPVVDLSGVSEGISAVNGMLPDGLNIGSSASKYVPDYLNSSVDNGDIVNAVTSLKEDVAYLGETIANIKLVLDTGTMVGAMTPAIDQELYTRQVYAGRGI